LFFSAFNNKICRYYWFTKKYIFVWRWRGFMFDVKKKPSVLDSDKTKKFNNDAIRICGIYFIVGFLWIFFSDRIASKIAINDTMLLIISTYKGWFYVLVTALMLYLLIRNLLKKVHLSEKKLSESYEELSAINQQLEAYVQQLSASEEEIRSQYDTISEKEKNLSRSEEKNRAIINALPDLLFIINSQGIFTDCMVNDERLLLLPKNQFVGKSIWSTLPDDISKVAFERLQSVLKNGIMTNFQYEMKIKKEVEYFELRMVKNNDNEVLAISRNITVEKKNELELIKSEERYRNLVDKMKQGLAVYEAVLDPQGEIIDFILIGTNESHEIVTGAKNHDIMGKSLFNIFPSKIVLFDKLKQVAITGEAIAFEDYLEEAHKNLEVIVYRPENFKIAVIITDINERKQMENKLEYLSYHDQLTGLYNRRFLEDEIKRIDTQNNLPITIFMADVNGLKLINDSFGHTIGDKLLKSVVEVLKKGCRSDDVIARLSGDEFVVLLRKTDSYEAEKIVKRIKALAAEEKVESVVEISVSFGYETKRNTEEPILEILKKAEDHMYKEKLFESPSMRGKTINTIITTLNEKNKREEQHCNRVSIFCERIGMALGLQEDKIRELKTVGMLHDIGKIAIEQNILNKSEKLTEEEWKEIRRHPEIGYRILSTVNDMSEMSEYVLAHHERWDGKGYPKGLKGEEIPLQSRIIAIAEAYDAMTSEGSYNKLMSEEAAVEELKINSNTQFDKELVDVFIEKVLNKSLKQNSVN
jgi:diguanylate cyclase (GGDEF)-like protein